MGVSASRTDRDPAAAGAGPAQLAAVTCRRRGTILLVVCGEVARGPRRRRGGKGVRGVPPVLDRAPPRWRASVLSKAPSPQPYSVTDTPGAERRSPILCSARSPSHPLRRCMTGSSTTSVGISLPRQRRSGVAPIEAPISPRVTERELPSSQPCRHGPRGPLGHPIAPGRTAMRSLRVA